MSDYNRYAQLTAPMLTLNELPSLIFAIDELEGMQKVAAFLSHSHTQVARLF